ncbi:hypothetical protein BDW68DRAFT_149052 [Aspergillus falconensis]
MLSGDILRSIRNSWTFHRQRCDRYQSSTVSQDSAGAIFTLLSKGLHLFIVVAAVSASGSRTYYRKAKDWFRPFSPTKSRNFQ